MYSVIRITTVKKQGYGWSGNFQAKYGFAMKNAWQEQANLNYRVGGLDVFGDSYNHGQEARLWMEW